MTWFLIFTFNSFNRCRSVRGVGTSASITGGCLTIAGGILTLTTAGAAAPLLIAGIATSAVGAGTNISASVIERIINSRQIKGQLILEYLLVYSILQKTNAKI